MCISLDKTNYCINGLIEKGKITARYLKLKVHEYENLRTEIEKLRQEVSASAYESQKQLTEVDKIWNPTR